MINLIKNELYKIFHRRSFIIMFIVILLLMAFTNYIMSQNNMYTYDEYEILNWQIEEQELYVESIDKDDYSGLADAMADLKILELKKENETSWASDYLDEQKINIFDYYYTYLSAPDSEYFLEIESVFEKIESDIQNDNWEEYVESLLLQIEFEINDATTSEEVAYYEYIEYLYNYRLENNVSYNSGYLNDAIESLIILKNDEYFSGEIDEASISMAEYILENDVDVYNTNNFINNMTNFFYCYVQFIILFVLVMAGSILSSEINKGTIKTLLISPYSRTKILISKYISVIIVSILAILIMILFQGILSAVFYDIKDITIPVLTYNSATSELLVENVFYYLIKQTIVYLPTLMFLSLITLAITIVISNSAIAIVGTFMIYIFSELINWYIVYYDLSYLKYLITLNWDFTTYMYGNTNAYECITLGFSIVVYLVYFIILGLISIKLFKKKNISNE